MTPQEYNELKAIYNKEAQPVIWNMGTILRGKGYIDRSTVVSTAYVLLLATNPQIYVDSFDNFSSSAGLDENRKAFLGNWLSDNWQMVAGQLYRYNENVLKSIILFYEDRDSRFTNTERTPDSLARLACNLFDFKDYEKIADFGLGTAAFTIEAYLNNPTLNFYGIETNAAAKEIASIRLEVLGCKINLEHGNIFDIDADTHKYRYIFFHYPFGLRKRDLGYDKYKMLQRILKKAPELAKGQSSDWFFNAVIMECLEEGGKGIAIMTNGSTWNGLDEYTRRYFIEKGYLEAVIALPARMFDYTYIPTTMIVLSKNNKQTMLIDATGMGEEGRRFTTFTDEQIEQIKFAVVNETEHSRWVSPEELKENDYVINPTRYLVEKIAVENGVPFGSLIKSITRGAQISASNLDKMVSKEPTEYQYLMLANIKNGKIDAELPYLKEIQENQVKYCLKNHSLILSKNGAPIKVAVAEVPQGKNILANGNLYVIEIDEEKADPYYIKVFLESEKGSALLKSITVGATIPNIGVEALKKMTIPLIPLEEQRAMTAKYLVKTDEIALLERKLQKAYEELKHIYDTKE